MANNRKINCPDCGVPPGAPHQFGCDVERCRVCGRQALGCGCNAPASTWTGEWPGVAECRKFGFYAKRNPSGPGWIPCKPDEQGATEDLNRLYSSDCVWNPTIGEWELTNQKMIEFVRAIARLTLYEVANDDAEQTLNNLIENARAICGKEEPCSNSET